MNTTYYRIVDSPVGPLTLAGHDDGLSHLCMHEQAHLPRNQDVWARDDRRFPAAVEQLDAYFAGTLTEFDLTLDMAGTPFQQAVWAGLRTIPYGETESYGSLALRIGRPGAQRAVGLANGRNPVAIVVPCHRVIGAGGTLVGYGGGLDRKQALLTLEQRLLMSAE